MSSFEVEKKFLHEIATPMTILKAIVASCLKKASENPDLLTTEYLKDRLSKAAVAMDQLEKLHANHKVYITQNGNQ